MAILTVGDVPSTWMPVILVIAKPASAEPTSTVRESVPEGMARPRQAERRICQSVQNCRSRR